MIFQRLDDPIYDGYVTCSKCRHIGGIALKVPLDIPGVLNPFNPRVASAAVLATQPPSAHSAKVYINIAPLGVMDLWVCDWIPHILAASTFHVDLPSRLNHEKTGLALSLRMLLHKTFGATNVRTSAVTTHSSDDVFPSQSMHSYKPVFILHGITTVVEMSNSIISVNIPFVHLEPSFRVDMWSAKVPFLETPSIFNGPIQGRGLRFRTATEETPLPEITSYEQSLRFAPGEGNCDKIIFAQGNWLSTARYQG